MFLSRLPGQSDSHNSRWWIGGSDSYPSAARVVGPRRCRVERTRVRCVEQVPPTPNALEHQPDLGEPLDHAAEHRLDRDRIGATTRGLVDRDELVTTDEVANPGDEQLDDGELSRWGSRPTCRPTRAAHRRRPRGRASSRWRARASALRRAKSSSGSRGSRTQSSSRSAEFGGTESSASRSSRGTPSAASRRRWSSSAGQRSSSMSSSCE